ncbi:hypothetical protein H7H78_16900 [Mycobacterium shinjukuense]|uniref:Uncharacterized protein n=1 Tax=Mycobacterium shinjukuense TaxID=398694 RepID=A0A7I7MUC9_9MYCO|nr:DUF2231 domain-containing protein [Mycobacterium shinjukuense]MCV6987032.1 hypothetical protein [Mycobacterium shinjukuense]ORB68089.1 hypothetical protein BST45_12165 [Mycobacterium shinjukuense]BBX75755.1 hypothetical protein MSHI_36610 [Mycobacterium shinjukuense]
MTWKIHEHGGRGPGWTLDGLPVHILINHLVVVLGPLAAILAIMCALWPAARQRLIWLTLALAALTLIVTPLTASSGTWLAGEVGASPAIDRHGSLGNTLAYFVGALVLAVTMLAIVQLRRARGRPVRSAWHAAVVIVVIAAAAATLVQTYRVGETGVRAVWGSFTHVHHDHNHDHNHD